MQSGSIDTGIADFARYGLNIERLRGTKTPQELSHAREVVQKAKVDLEQAIGSNNKDKNVEELINRLNELAHEFEVQLRFSVKKEGPSHIKVQVVNTRTNEVIRELPFEYFHKVGSKLINDAGVVIDKMA